MCVSVVVELVVVEVLVDVDGVLLLLIITGIMVFHSVEFVGGNGTGFGDVLFLEAWSSSLSTFCTLIRTSCTPGTADESSPISVATAGCCAILSVTVDDAAGIFSGRF